MKLWAYALALALDFGGGAGPGPRDAGLAAQDAGCGAEASYTGTFVYQNAGRSETSRITRFVDAGGESRSSKRWTAAARDRAQQGHGARATCPGARLVKVDRRTERGFPALLPERICGGGAELRIRLGETRRIAGYDARRWCSRRSDNLRYGHRL